MESLAEIRQLPYRYALALDSRDMDAVADLFVPDVRVGRDEFGRAALHPWYTEAMRASRTTIHQVTNHIVDFDDATAPEASSTAGISSNGPPPAMGRPGNCSTGTTTCACTASGASGGGSFTAGSWPTHCPDPHTAPA
ncbi:MULTISPECIES: nuclear transport factor 2 family protein [unclassified Streptomyces]|uniref:nuclear transport factor 2 family protein n=1 Tax=unclassified Streptomyces TaxID=2593676 RepID=UPI00338EEF83